MRGQRPHTREPARVVRETLRGYSVTVLQSLATATIAIQQKRWRAAGVVLELAARTCMAMHELEPDAEAEAAEAEGRRVLALRRGRPE